MALEEVQKFTYVKARDVAMGTKVEGYVVGVYRGGKYPDIDCLKMRSKDGKEFIFGGGSLRYFFKNQNKAGFYYSFERIADKPTKGQPSAQFKILIDKSDTCAVENMIEAPAADTAAMQIPF